MSAGWTMKYGILTPSLEVASSCSTTSCEESNFAGNALISCGEPDDASVNQSEPGVRNPLIFRNARFERLSAAPYPIAMLSGRSSLAWVQPPSAVGLYIQACPRTLSRVESKSLSRVELTWRSESLGPGDQTGLGCSRAGSASTAARSSCTSAPGGSSDQRPSN